MNTLREVLANVNRVSRKDGLGECWEWTRGRSGGKYGVCDWRSHGQVKVHRLVYCLLNGQLSDDEVVRHLCDNPSCVNPSHLMSGTYLDNVRDACERNRNWRRITPDQAAMVRLLARQGAKYSEIGKVTGVKRTMVGLIATGERWKFSGDEAIAKRNPRKLTESQKREIVEMRRNGLTFAEIGRRFAISDVCASYTFRRYENRE